MKSLAQYRDTMLKVVYLNCLRTTGVNNISEASPNKQLHFRNKACPQNTQPATANISKQHKRKTSPKSLIISRHGNTGSLAMKLLVFKAE